MSIVIFVQFYVRTLPKEAIKYDHTPTKSGILVFL